MKLAIKLVQAELDWHLTHRGNRGSLSDDYVEGYLAGLRQALIVLRTKPVIRRGEKGEGRG